MTDFGQSGPFNVGKKQPALDLGFKNPVFSDERYIAKQQFLIDSFRWYRPVGKASPSQSSHSQTR